MANPHLDPLWWLLHEQDEEQANQSHTRGFIVEAAQVFTPGAAAAQVFTPGLEAGKVAPL